MAIVLRGAKTAPDFSKRNVVEVVHALLFYGRINIVNRERRPPPTANGNKR